MVSKTRTSRHFISLIVVCAITVVFAATSAYAQDTKKTADLKKDIVGVWGLVSYKVEDKETGRTIDAMGSSPRGRVIFTPHGWVAFNLEGSDRQPPKTDVERAHLMKTLVAYIGRYRIEGNQWVTNVQTAWTPEWVGTEQRRTIEINGDFANVITPWRIMPNWDSGKLSRSIIRFKRIE
ncbi:lipocalin-like domain-containing protein [Gluconobacter sp. R75690]|uniref:lipocalin-like domain-containing protein n=1 Tax=Gluconobacter potus TaxID=2724927 RepID=UPI00188A7559|nr:lipocalin-like domain-containing protein [Gluconobacter sp. R75690]MBF0881076.1 lipocalin-like domain-containing protein [Gluconobacter sp. R75828]